MVAMLARLTLTLASALCACDGDDRPEVPIDSDSGDVAVPPDAPSGPTRCEESAGKQDFDRDGFTPTSGDCDDCDAARGPGALDVPGDGVDQDCDGADAVGPAASCDDALDADGDEDGIAIDDVARALGLCAKAREGRPGLIEARWLRLDGSERLADIRQAWLPPRFGARVMPREGGRMLVLSTGVARDLSDDAYTPACDVFSGARGATSTWPGGVPLPKGFPHASSVCDEPRIDPAARAYDDVGLELLLRAPSNAVALAFDSILFSAAYPDFLCAPSSDGFVALLEDAPERFADGNVLVDAENDPVGADSSLLTVCARARRGAREVACTDAILLEGTGYARAESTCAPRAAGDDDVGGAATGWLRTTVRVAPGSTFTLRFHLWDAGDPLLDTTIALDHLRFLTTPVDERAPATMRE
ncbi:MAG: putative metal-binding motif-containing protein [Polyangiales bacterium]